MLHRQPVISILAVFALLLGNAAGWVHVLVHSDGHCGCAPTEVVCGDSDPSSGLHSASDCDSKCTQSPLRARWMAERGADESTECCDSKIVTDPGKHAPTPHESDECAICQHFLACRDQAVFANNPLIVSLGIPTESVSVARQMIRSDFQDSVHFLRGPPVA